MSASTSLSTAPSRPATLPPQVGTDRRSSSLSDVGERLKQDDMDAMNVGEEDSGDDNDTEAETERLDDTPIKSMEQRIVVRAPGSTINELTQNRSPARGKWQMKPLPPSTASIDCLTITRRSVTFFVRG